MIGLEIAFSYQKLKFQNLSCLCTEVSLCIKTQKEKAPSESMDFLK